MNDYCIAFNEGLNRAQLGGCGLTCRFHYLAVAVILSRIRGDVVHMISAIVCWRTRL